MGYRVVYDSVRQEKRRAKSHGARLTGLTAMFLALFLMMVNVYWPKGREVLQEMIWPGDAAVTRQAAEAFVEELRFGEPIGDAVESFCREIIKSADIYG